MRLPRLTLPNFGRRRARLRHQARPRLRQLERRRVLDAAIQSLMIAPTVPAEGQTVTATATATGDGPLTFDWTVTEDDVPIATGSNTNINANDSVTFQFSLPDDTQQMEHVYTLHLAVSDGNGDPATIETNLDVVNAPPVLFVSQDRMVSEGQLLNLSGVNGQPLGLFTDAGTADTHTATIDWGDGSPVEDATVSFVNGSGTIGGTHTYADDGVYTVTVTVTDDDGGSDTESLDVTVKNVPPVLFVSQDRTVDEGQVLNLSGVNAQPIGLFTDDGVNDTHTATIDWGDGSAVENATVNFTNGSGSLGGTHTYADQGVYTVTITVTDDDGGSDTESFQVTVGNVAPTAALGNDGPVNEGSTAEVMFTGQFDPSTADTSAGFRYAYDFDNDGTFDVGDGTYAGSVVNDTQTVPATFLDDGPATRTVRARILDKDGGFTDYTTDIAVVNVPPTLDDVMGDVISEDEVATVTATIVDPSMGDVFEVDVNWQDGSTATITGLGATDASGSVGTTSYQWTAATRELTLRHQYLDDNPSGTASDIYQVSLVVRDDDAGSTGPYSAPVTVNNVPPILFVSQNRTVNEGQLLNLTGIDSLPIALFTDDGRSDTHTATIDWGDGTVVDNATVSFTNGSGFLGGSHTYADDGVYTVTVTVTDDDGGTDTEQFLVTVRNVAPALADTEGVAVDEGSAFTLTQLGVNLSDPGFDNPLNPIPGGETQETFAIHSINWGDGSPTDTSTVAIVNRDSGASGMPTTADIAHAAHTYADDGVYTVIIRVADDDMGAFSDPSLFTTGVAGVDYVDLVFTIRVDNVAPTLTSVTPSTTTINESEGVSFTAFFSDPGFDNPLNPNSPMPPTIADPLNESFTYDIDWGDGRQEQLSVAVADMNGSPGVPSTGTFGGSHVYADDGVYTVTVTIHDDNGGSHVQTFEVTVLNVNPSFVPTASGASFEGDDVNQLGLTQIRVAYNDPGFDNPDNPNAPAPPTVTDTLHESFTHVLNWGDGTVDAVHTYVDPGVYTVEVSVMGPNGTEMYSFTGVDSSLQPVLTLVSSQEINDPSVMAEAYTFVVDWGDGNVQTITLLLKQPGPPIFNNGLTTVLASQRTSGGETELTTGSFEVRHRYLGPPNPANASAPIRIDVTIVDDNNGLVSDFIMVRNPGAQTINVAIDTTPEVPRLDITPPPPVDVFIVQPTAFLPSLQQSNARLATSDLTITSERYLELEVIAPDGTVVSTHRIRDEALLDLRKFFATLPDNHYRIYLVRTDNNSRRLIMDVYVRRGRIIDPSDDSEGTRDKPPTNEEIRPDEVPRDPPLPLEDNPLLEPAPATGADDTNASMPHAAQHAKDVAYLQPPAPSPESPSPSLQPQLPRHGSPRWAVPLTALSLAAGRRNWSQRISEALENADERDWQRLRRAGRMRMRR